MDYNKAFTRFHQNTSEPIEFSVKSINLPNGILHIVTTSLQLMMQFGDFHPLLHHGGQCFADMLLQAIKREGWFIRDNVHVF